MDRVRESQRLILKQQLFKTRCRCPVSPPGSLTALVKLTESQNKELNPGNLSGDYLPLGR